MAGAAALAIVVIPILIGFWIKGKIPADGDPLNRFLIAIYHPLLLKVLSKMAEVHLAGGTAVNLHRAVAAQQSGR
ncbi:hypothetical protein ACNKHQ_02770 [Shigella flexneri]